jgi:PKHD-type hydroxylase
MILVVPGVLSPEELAHVRSSLAGARFVDGRASAGALAQEQKHVLQLDRTGNSQREVGELVARALLRHPKVQAAALPKSIRHPSINRYEAGMYYGRHLDAPLMSGAVTTRTDLSVTVFLSEASDYAGGELVIEAQPSPITIKAGAGDAVLYSSGSIHQVKPVESGVRLVAVTWLQSLVQSAEQRRLLFELGEAIAALEAQDAKNDVLLRLRATRDNLLRMWVEA